MKERGPEHIQVSLDMRCANGVIQGERHVTPTVDDILVALNGSILFSKLDMKNRYHQLDLDATSRVITTFPTLAVPSRYKRLNFVVISTARAFRDTLRQVVANIPDVFTVSDDILVCGKNER
ncbi:hypothetical protein MRX96_012034 [Rhipicephalus microplus]